MSIRAPLGGVLGVLAVVVCTIGGIAIAVGTGGARPHSVASGGRWRSLSVSCPSPALGGQLPAQVYLPPGYNARRQRHRVIYFLHGLPAGPQSYRQSSFVAHALPVAGERAIVVAPQGARKYDSDPEYLNWSGTGNWPRALSHDLPRCIDRRFRTIANRRGRALIGVSAGGYGALNIGLRDLARFAVIESWSGYFTAADPSGRRVLKLSSLRASRKAAVPHGPGLARELRRFPTLIAFYVGRSDARFVDVNQAFDAALRREGIGHVFRTYAGGHDLALWRSEAPAWLAIAMRYLRDDEVPQADA